METFLELMAVLGFAIIVSGLIMLIIFLVSGELSAPIWWQRRKALKNLVRIRWSPDGSKYLENQLEQKIYDLEHRIHTIETRKRGK